MVGESVSITSHSSLSTSVARKSHVPQPPQLQEQAPSVRLASSMAGAALFDAAAPVRRGARRPL